MSGYLFFVQRSPGVAVVVITRDRPALLARTLARLSEMPERPAVIVVDNGSRSSIRPPVLRALPDAGLLCLPGNIGAAARNIGVRLARSEYVAFSDDDSWWEPGSLARALEIMSSDDHIGLLAGRIRVEPSGEDDPICEQMAGGPLGEDLTTTAKGRRAVTGFLACAAVVRTRAFLAVGGFPLEMLVGGEEQMVAWDLWSTGWKALYAPEICAVHHPAPGRDPRVRRRLTTRNDLWSGWLRLPGGRLASHTRTVLQRTPFDTAALAGATDALRQLRSVAARRSPMPPAVAAAVCARL